MATSENTDLDQAITVLVSGSTPRHTLECAESSSKRRRSRTFHQGSKNLARLRDLHDEPQEEELVLPQPP